MPKSPRHMAPEFFALPLGILIALFCVGLPSGLFDRYREMFGFGNATQTLLFAVYAFTLVPALLLSPVILRKVEVKTLYLVGLASLCLAGVSFIAAEYLPFGVAWLFAGRAFQGITVGFLNASTPPILLALERRGLGSFDPIVVGLVTALGLGSGLFTGKLASGYPVALFSGTVAATIVLGVAVASMHSLDRGGAEAPAEETAAARSSNTQWNSLAGWAGGVAWVMGGLFLGLGTVISQAAAPQLVAAVPAVFFAAMIAGQFSTKLLGEPLTPLVLGLGGSMVSSATTALSVFLASAGSANALTLTLLLASSVLGGFCLGVVFVLATGIYQSTIDPKRQNTQTAWFFTKVFGGNSLPTLGVGIVSSLVGLPGALAILAAMVCAGAAILISRVTRAGRQGWA